MIKKSMIILSVLVLSLFLFLWSCTPVSDGGLTEEERELFGDQAVAGKAISYGCNKYTVERCSELGHTVTYVYIGTKYTRTDSCGNFARDYSCVGSTTLQLCSEQCEAGETCNGGVCVRPETCNGVDDTSDGVIDEGCDDDNDGYCDAGMTFVGTSTCSGDAYGDITVYNSNCCVRGNDCDDTNNGINPGRTFARIGRTLNEPDNEVFENELPGDELSCNDAIDNDCDGMVNDGCRSCTDNDPTNDPTRGGTLTIARLDDGTVLPLTWIDSRYYRSSPGFLPLVDSCYGTPVGSINETICNPSAYGYDGLPGFIRVLCPSGTTCTDPDGSTGVTPAVCS